MIYGDTHTYGWVYWCMDGLMDGSCHITKNGINLDFIQIIQFCLKIYDLCRHPTDGLRMGSCENTKNNIDMRHLYHYEE